MSLLCKHKIRYSTKKNYPELPFPENLKEKKKKEKEKEIPFLSPRPFNPGIKGNKPEERQEFQIHQHHRVCSAAPESLSFVVESPLRCDKLRLGGGG